MQHYSISDLADRLVTYGRTFQEPEEDILYFNWSGSTVEFMFSGTQLSRGWRIREIFGCVYCIPDRDPPGQWRGYPNYLRIGPHELLSVSRYCRSRPALLPAHG